MISIVVCSVDEGLFKQLSLSISETIGIEYEIIRIENTSNPKGISEIYNEGVSKSKYQFICFVHEDVIFKSAGWGLILTDFLRNNPQAGVLGVAGSRYKSLVPGIWASGLFDTDFVNIIQHEPRYKRVSTQHTKPLADDSSFCEVVTLDGVFLFARKEVCMQYPFDQDTFQKFHCYDLDFSLQAGKNWKLYVTYEVLIEHLSSGSLNADWVEESVKLSRKWAEFLPAGNLPPHQRQEIEWRNRTIFFYRMNILGFNWRKTLSYFFQFGYFKNFSLSRNMDFIKELVQKKLK